MDTADAASRAAARRRYLAVYLGLLLGFGWEVGRLHHAHTGFSALIDFGDMFAARRLPQLAQVPLYTQAGSAGYDGQFYAQLAVAGDPFDPGLRKALDGPAYRTRRILLPALVHLVGAGDPGRIIQIYALANLFCLLVLAALLARWWFPPGELHNLLRWAGTLFGAGMVVSVTRSLTDGPALLVIAIGGRLVEQNRRWLGAAVLAAAGLVRETSVLCAAAFVGRRETPRERLRAAAAAALCVAPTLVWAAVLAHHYGGGSAGSRNFDLPLVSFGKKLAELYRGCRAGGFDLYTRTEVFAVVAMATQVGLLIFRPRLDLVWWRIGAAFALLWMVLGWAVWESSPSAAIRAVLPLTLAFNILAPRTRRGLLLLVVGNLTVLSTFDVLRMVPTEQTIFEDGVTLRYQTGWFGPEHLGRHNWRWASGAAELTLENPTARTLRATLSFQLASVTPRTVTLHAPDGRLPDRTFTLASPQRLPDRYGPLPLPPGRTTVTFSTPEPPWVEPVTSRRPLTFALYDLFVDVAP
ncbi:MAG TPA: hypothetical protein VHO06_14300 [Polyangia bacterium]|nr:hypothetical protein [Polyangia bacterium]